MATQTISTAEAEKKTLRPENIVKLCTALEIRADYLLPEKVSAGDYDILSKGFASVLPQYRHLKI